MSKVKTVPKLCLDLDCSRGELKSNNLQLLVQRCLKSKQYQSYAWTWIRPGVSWFGLVWNPFLLTQIRSTRFQSSSGRSAHLVQIATECSSTRCNAPQGAAQVCYTSSAHASHLHPVIFCSPTRSMGNVAFLSQICTCTHASGSSTPGAAGR